LVSTSRRVYRHVLVLFGLADVAFLGHGVFLHLEVVLPEHLPHGNHAIKTSRVGPVQLPWDLEGSFLKPSSTDWGGQSKHHCRQKSDKEEESK
jgi:hypothetical protein